MKSFHGKNVFLTGAGSGIGKALAEQLWQKGCNLLLVDVNKDALNQLVQDLNPASANDCQWIQTFVCDLSSAPAIDNMLADVGAKVDVVDVVINNAGVAYYGPTDGMSMEQWDWLMNINLSAPIRVTQHFLPMLMTRPDAHIVNMCSISGMVAGGRFAAYHTSKFGLIGFTEALRAEFGRKGIGVTAICPGPVRTELYKAAASGRANQSVPEPPAWACTTPEKVATATLKAMQKNRRQVLLTPMAHALFQMKRFAPGLIDFANQFSRKKKKRLAALQAEENQRLASMKPETTEVQIATDERQAA